MTAVRKRLERAAEYRGRAMAATALAEASPLDNVRERHEAAAARWLDLAEMDERSVESHAPVNTFETTSTMLFAGVPLT